MSGVDPDLVDLIGSVFERHHDPNNEVHGPLALNGELWSVLAESGLTRLTEPEESGGSGAGWSEAAVLLSAAGEHLAAVPLAESDLLAGYLLDAAGRARDGATRTACVLGPDGSADAVPWAGQVERITLLWRADGWRVADVPADSVDITPGVNLASEPRDGVRIDVSALQGAPVPESVLDGLLLRGALARSIATCGALDRVLAICVAHTIARVQFGRPLAKFQAVQAMVAAIATESALARAATENAVSLVAASDWRDPGVAFAVAAAKSTSAHGASLAARKAHQSLGAIGFTMEHELHRYANRILSWRSEFGSVRYWDDRLTDAALAAGSSALWPLVEGNSV